MLEQLLHDVLKLELCWTNSMIYKNIEVGTNKIFKNKK